MTVISPYQRQLVFTRSFSGSLAKSRRKKGFLSQVIVWWENSWSNKTLPVHGVYAVNILLAGAILVFGIQAVLISFQKDSLALQLKQARLEREGLEIKSTELLSAEALRTYADMVQLSQPNLIRYLSAETPVIAQRQ
jgi:hypothetical protein